MRVTQQGRYLIGALGALGLAVAVLVIEHFWITDAERIERVVYDLRAAVLASDVEWVLSQMTPDVQFVREGETIAAGEATRDYIRAQLPHAKFDFLRISHLRTEVFPQSRRGTAEFRVIAAGSWQTPQATLNFGTTNFDWSLGFTEARPDVWKIDRITPTRVPREMPGPSGSGSPGPFRRDRSRSRISRPR
jgi:hypothetical protein